MTRPRLLDLFCGAGGAAMGYHRAGFEVVGVDNRPQPRYPFEFHQADAMTYPLEGFDAIHASPVCLTFTPVTDWRGSRDNYPDTLTPTLQRLEAVSVPWVVENVPEACPPLRGDLLLCGSQFGLNVRRHRAFQLGNWSMPYSLMPACNCGQALPFMHKGEREYTDAMGCTWMDKTSGRQAIPPEYTRFIGETLREQCRIPSIPWA